MIAEYIRYRIAPERADPFVDAYRAATDPLLSSPHRLRFALARCEKDPAAFTVRIEWSSTESNVQRFRGSAEFRGFFAHAKPFVRDIEQTRHYAVSEARMQDA